MKLPGKITASSTGKIKYEVEIEELKKMLKEMIENISKWLNKPKEFREFMYKVDRYIQSNFFNAISLLHSPSQTNKGSEEWHNSLWDLYSALSNYTVISTKIQSKSIKRDEIENLKKELNELLELSGYENLTTTGNGINNFNRKLSQVNKIFSRG